MTKQEKFLWMVQTTILANCINLATKTAGNDPHITAQYSGSTVSGLCADALYASERIPQDYTAEEAAFEFCGHFVFNDKEEDYSNCYWMLRQ